MLQYRGMRLHALASLTVKRSCASVQALPVQKLMAELDDTPGLLL